MANQIPLKVRRTNGNTDALAEFESGDLISVAHGGTGAGDAAAARAALAVAAQADLAAHVGNTNNPHNVTATQVGAIAASEKGAALGVATLDAGGKVPAVQIPAVALPSVSVVADAAARAALTVQEGDEATQTDDGSHWIYDGTSWIQRTTGAGGDVVGPAGTADNALARFDGATGKIIQSSVATVDDAGNLNFPGNITAGGTIDGRDVAADGAALDAHAANTNNPHAVTAAQVGADPAGSAAAVQTALTTHAAATNNPHAVTATQVGAIAASEKGAALGVATLDAGGKVPAVQIPAVALPSVSVVADAAARAALTVQEGDEAIQTDDGSHWIYDGTSWIQRTTGAGGDVVGPAGTADNALARFDGATGKIIQSSVATVDDAGNLNFPGNITTGGTIDGRDVAADGAALTAHAANANNPHSVTAIQVGADPAGSAAAVQTALTTHATATNNPHAVTATQVGAVPEGAYRAGRVFADAAARDSYAAWSGLIAVLLGDDSWWQYSGSAWATYAGVRPLYMIGTSTAAAVNGHLQNGVVYDEEA